MILQSLCAYYNRMSLDADSGMPRHGFSEEGISFALSLRPNGSLARVVDLRICDKKPKPRRMPVPAAVKRTGNIEPNFLWDNTGYVFGVDSKGKADQTQKKFAAFCALHQKAAELNDHPAIRAMCMFLSTWKPENFDTLDNADLIRDQNCIFMWDETGAYIHDMPDIVRPASNADDNDMAWCLVSGERKPIARLHPSIKGVLGAQSMGASIVSFNEPAYESFGKIGKSDGQGKNAPVSEEATFAYTTALNYLLRRDNGHCIQIGDATTVFWAERATPAEEMVRYFFAGSPNADASPEEKETSDAVHSMLDALRQGRSIETALPGIDPDVTFYILGLSPNAARIALRFWHVSTFDDLARHVAAHADALSIVRQSDKQAEYPTLWQLLIETAVQGKSENISPTLSGALTRAVLTGNTYPYSLYAAVISRIRAEKTITYLRAALIKAYLVRNKKQEVSYMLDEEKKSVPYRLGRLFALLEKVQIDALGKKINKTIRDRYFGAASATPGVVFPQLLRLAQHHISKSDYGSDIERRIRDVMWEIDAFPAHLTQDQQGEFFLGYYHQCQANYQKTSREKE